MKFVLILYILFIFLFAMILLTPNQIANYFIGFLCTTIMLDYIYEDEPRSPIHQYVVHHSEYDGELLSSSIKKQLIKPKILTNRRYIGFEDHQYLTTERIHGYSLFTSAVAVFGWKVARIQKKDLRIGIIVSTRNLITDKMRPGNYIKHAYYTIKKNDSLLEICEKHNNAVQRVKNTKTVTNTLTFIDGFRFPRLDYLIDSQRSLSRIPMDNGRVLIRSNRYFVTKDQMNRLHRANGRTAMVMLDFMNNKYLVSNIVYV